MDYNTLSTRELRRIARERGHKGVAIAGARKSQLVALLVDGTPIDAPTMPTSAAPSGDLADIIAQAVSGRVGFDRQELIALVSEAVDDATDEMDARISAKLASIGTPTIVEVHKRETREVTSLGVQHRQFPTLLAMAQAQDKDSHCPPIYLHGPAGTGKTTAARMLAKALDLPFYFNGAIDSEYKLSGFVDAGGVFRSRPFYDAYSSGGVYLFDELDSSLPSAVLAFNAALANGHADFPVGSVDRHKDCIILAAGNTTLRGDGVADGYARFEMDAAFRDRFVFLDWQIDEQLESACVPADRQDWLELVRRARRAVVNLGIAKSDITPRATFAGIALLDAGLGQGDVINATIRKGLPDSQWAQVQEAINV
jgi:cobaltochelatase CobS